MPQVQALGLAASFIVFFLPARCKGLPPVGHHSTTSQHPMRSWFQPTQAKLYIGQGITNLYNNPLDPEAHHR